MNDIYSFHLYSVAATYGATPNFITSSQFPRTGFVSVYGVTKETAEAIKQTGTSKMFKGVVWSERLTLDFDGYPAAERAESRLREYGYDFNAYDTGGRGAHFSILRSASPSHLLPLLDKQWVKENFPEADPCIYTHLHPIRLEGTKHEKTGNYKRLVCENRGSAITLSPLKEEHLHLSQAPSEGRGNKSVFDHFRLGANTTPATAGERHQQLIKILYILKDELNVSIDNAYFWVTEWNKMCSPPKSEEDLEKAIRSIYG